MLKIILQGDSTGAVKAFGDVSVQINKLETQVAGIAGKLKASWINMAAGLMVVQQAVEGLRVAWDLAAKSASFEEQKRVLQSMTGQADIVIDKLKEAAKHQIDMAQATGMATKAMQMGLSVDQIVAYTQQAEKLSDVVQGSITEIYEKMTTAAAKGKVTSLAELGLIVDLDAAYERAAASMGKKVEQLTKIEKQSIRYNAVLNEAVRMTEGLGEGADSAADKMDRLAASARDMQLHLGTAMIRIGAGAAYVGNAFGIAFMRITEFFTGGVVKAETAVNALIEIYNKVAIRMGMSQVGKVTAWSDALKWQQDAIKAMTNNMRSSWDLMVAGTRDISGSVKPQLEEIGRAAKASAEDIAKLNERIQDLIDKGTMTPDELIDKQAAAWKKLGAEQVLIASWVAMERKKLRDKEAEEDEKARQKDLEEVLKHNQSVLDAEDRYQDLLFDMSADTLDKKLRVWDKWYDDVTEQLDKMALDDERYNELSASAHEGMMQMKVKVTAEYLAEMEQEWKSHGNEITKVTEDALNAATDSFSDLFFDAITGKLRRLEDYFRAVWQSILRGFTNILGQMAAQAIAKPIIVSIIGGLGASMGLPSLAGAAGIGQLGLFGGAISNVTGLLSNFGQALLGSQQAFYNLFQGGMSPQMLGWDAFGGAMPQTSGLAQTLGSVIPYLPLLMPMFQMLRGNWQSGIGGAAGFGAGALLGGIGSIFPGIGTVIGMLIGSFFKKKVYPELFVEFMAGVDASGWQAGKHWTGGALDVTGGAIGMGYKNVGDWSKETQAFLQMFAEVRAVAMGALEDLGLDISGFFKDWKLWIPDLTGKTAEEIQSILKQAMGEYVEFASGIDFTQWQKSGEELIDTVQRILAAFKAFPQVLESIDDYIAAINQQGDELAKWKQSLADAEGKLEDMWQALEKLEDPADILNAINQLKSATYEYYMSQIQFVQQLDAAIKSLEVEMANFQISMLQKIGDMTGAIGASIGAIWAHNMRLMDNYNAATGAGDKLQWLQQIISSLDEWVSANIAAIQARYQAEIDAVNRQIDTINKQKDTINKQLDGLREQLRLTQAWKGVLESVRKQILDMATTTASPADVFERMEYLKSEMDKVKGLYLAETDPMKKADYAKQLQDLIRQYLGIAQEAFQRPSPEYLAIYKQMIDWLQEIQGTAAEYASKEERLLEEIKQLEEQSKLLDEQIKALQESIESLNRQMQADIEAFKQNAAQYYEWAMSEGMRLYQEKLDELKEKLGDILGELTLQEYIALKQKEATEALQALREWADNYWTNMQAILSGGGGGTTLPSPTPSPTPTPSDTCPICGATRGQHMAWCPYANEWLGAAGGLVTRTTKMVVGEAGPEWIIPLSKMKEFQQPDIVVAPQITINSSGQATAEEIAHEVERQIVYSLKYGKARAIMREA